MFDKFRKNESGQSMVLVGLMLFVLFGFGAMAVDVGYMTYQRSELQNAADSSALAGAMLINKSNVEDKIVEYAYSNIGKIPAENAYKAKENLTALKATVSSTVNVGEKTVLVEIEQEVPRFLSGVISSADPSIMKVRAKALTKIKWSGEAMPFVNTGYMYNSQNIILRTNTSPGDKSQIYDFYSKDVAGDTKYYVDYGDGVILDQGNGNTKSVIDGTALNTAVADILSGVQVGDVFYLLSLKSGYIEDYYDGTGVEVADKDGDIVSRTSGNGGFKADDTIDPNMLILLKCTYVSHKTANGTEIELKYENEEYDVIGGTSFPTELESSVEYTSLLIE